MSLFNSNSHLVAAERAAQDRANDVAAQARAREHADQAGVALRVVPGPFERLPRALEEDALLRIHQIRFARREAEERGVEQIGAVEHTARLDVIGLLPHLRRHAGGLQLRVAEEPDALDAVAQVLPERIDIGGARKPSGEADDRNRTGAVLRGTAPSAGGGLFGKSAARFPVLAAEMAGQRRDRRVLEQIENRDGAAEHRRQAALHLDEEQRVPAQVEEAVGSRRHRRVAGPRARRRRCVARRPCSAATASTTAADRSGAGSAARSTLPFGVSGSASSTT